jgi:hypothetical protein
MLWSLFMGDEPEPEDEEKMPLWMRQMAWNMVDGTSAPIFMVSQMATTSVKKMLDLPTYNSSSGIPALDSLSRLGGAVAGLLHDATLAEEELTTEKVMEDIRKIMKQVLAPYRQGAKMYENRFSDDW